MANQPPNETAPAAAENRETTAPSTPAPAAPPPVAKPAKSPPAARSKAAATTRPRSTAKRSKAPAKRRRAPGADARRQASVAPAAPTTLPRATKRRAGLGVTVAELVESNARPYASAQEQLASATQGTWIAPVAELNARVITRVAAAQANLARQLLG